MNKELLINRAIAILSRAGFIVSERLDVRPRSFDIAARRDNLLLLIKVISNIDGLNEETAGEMQFLSRYLNGYPVVIGEKTRDHALETGVVYFRYGVPAFDINTMQDYFMEDAPPLIFAEHGGLYVNIEGNILKQERIQKNISLGALASLLGVSRRTISKYEEGEMSASVDVALRLEEILDKGLAVAVDLFGKLHFNEGKKHEVAKNSNVFSILKEMGFNVLPISQAPFDAVSQSLDSDKQATILTGIGEYTRTTLKKAHLMSSISEVALTQSVLIVHGTSKMKNVEQTVLVEEKELRDFNDTEEFMNLLHERKSMIEAS